MPVGVNNGESEFNTVNKTGGNKTVTLTVEQMPTHNHAQYVGSQYGSWGVRRDYAGDGNCASYPQGTTGSTGGSAPHDNLPPYKTTYFWQRTA